MIATDGNDDFGADGLPSELGDHLPNPESRHSQSEEASLLRKAIQSLRPNLWVVVQIHLQERSMRETAKATGISLVAAKGRLFHAKNALRTSLIRNWRAKLDLPVRFAFRLQSNGSRRAKARTRFDNQQQSNDKEEGYEYVIETKETRKYRAPSNLHHDGGDTRGFGEELGA